jgi:hypothetical protein
MVRSVLRFYRPLVNNPFPEDTMDIASTPTSHIAQATEPFWRRPGVVTAVRSLYVVAGAIGAAIALVCTGFMAAIADCSGDATGLCTNYAGLVPVIEWALVLAAFAASLAGGIVACVRREWPWLVAGLFTAVVMFALTAMVAEGQTGLLS